MSALDLARLHPDELEALLQDVPVAVLPIGTLEWHSHHLPIGLDGIVAEAVGVGVAARLGAALLPTSYWAVGGVPYPFTFRLSPGVVEPLLVAGFETLAEMGFRVVVAFTGHFGLDHTLTLKRAALAVMRRSPVTILAATEYDLVTESYRGDHAGAGETSLLWHLAPELVRTDRLDAESAALDGVQGEDPRGAADPERGRELFERIVQRTASVAARLLRATPPVARADYVEAVAAAVRVLERTAADRAQRPKSEVPPVTTPAYLDHCRAMARGDYREAREHAERKLADLSA